MLKRSRLLLIAAVSMVGTRPASAEGNAGLPDEAVDKGSYHVGRRLGADLGIYIGTITFGREGPDQQSQRLDVQMSVDACSGEGCQKKIQYVITCRNKDGYTLEVGSPWYKNWATSGLVTKTYRFRDPRLSQCDFIDQIAPRVEPGWEGAID